MFKVARWIELSVNSIKGDGNSKTYYILGLLEEDQQGSYTRTSTESKNPDIRKELEKILFKINLHMAVE